VVDVLGVIVVVSWGGLLVDLVCLSAVRSKTTFAKNMFLSGLALFDRFSPKHEKTIKRSKTCFSCFLTPFSQKCQKVPKPVPNRIPGFSLVGTKSSEVSKSGLGPRDHFFTFFWPKSEKTVKNLKNPISAFSRF